MKKALLYGLSAVVLLSLTACGTAQANQPDEPDPPPTPTLSAVQTEPPQESPAPENAMEPLSAVQKLADEDLRIFFEQVYESGKIYEKLGIDDTEGLILLEVGEVASLANVRTDVVLPDDYEAQYRAWRMEAHPDVPAEIQLFTDCSETVYATDQVNIRSSYSTDSEKLGSLSGGQSITRIGNAIAGTEAERLV